MAPVDTFRRLHADGCFAMPNAWDVTSARALEALGYVALATTSSGLGRSLGKDDHLVTRPELVAHVAELTAVLGVPLSVDGEHLYPHEPGGVEETVRLLADAGASGCSIEDWDPADGGLLAADEATERVAAAADACARHGLVLTARAENLLYGVDDLDDTIARLVAYGAAGAEVLFAPGLTDPADIGRVVAEAGRPVSVLRRPSGPDLTSLAELGVRRVSTGGALQLAAARALRDRAAELLGPPG